MDYIYVFQTVSYSIPSPPRSHLLDRLFRQLISLDLPAGEFAIFGSGPLIIRGVIPAANDLDIICRGAAWERAKLIGTVQHSDEYGVTIATIYDGQISFGTEWGIGIFDVDNLIDGAEMIGGLPFVQLRHVIRYKMERASPKDLRHIEALKNSNYSGETD